MINDKLFIHHPAGVRVLIDSSARQFLPTEHFDYNEILGLNKPKNRVKALTGYPKHNCKVGKKYIIPFWALSSTKQALFELELGLLLTPEGVKKFMGR